MREKGRPANKKSSFSEKWKERRKEIVLKKKVEIQSQELIEIETRLKTASSFRNRMRSEGKSNMAPAQTAYLAKPFP